MSAEPNSLSAGVQGPLKRPGSSSVVLMLFRAIWALFLSILIFFLWIKKPIGYPILGGGGHLLHPPWIRHWVPDINRYIQSFTTHLSSFVQLWERLADDAEEPGDGV